MIFFFNANGDLLKGNPDTVYQGSSNAGKIYAVAPLNPGLIADIYFTLPNGDEAGPYLLTNGGTIIEGKELPDGYALWFINLNSNLTQFAGDLTAQIGFYATEDMTVPTADGVAQKVPVITTQAFNITIARGVARTLPAEPTNDVYEQIVNTLTLLSTDISKISGIYPPASIKDIGEAAVTYDTTDGVTLKTTEQWTGTDGETFDIETERELPIKGGKNIAIDVTEDGKFIEVKSTADPIEQDEKGKPGGVPTLDSNGQIPSSQLPTYVDDVIDGYVVGATPFAADWLSKTPNGAPLTPERDKIYIVVSEGEYINIEYRWSGTVYAELGKTTPLSDTTGQGTNIGMTQKAITDELAKKQDALAIYTVNTTAEVTIPADDLAKIKADPNAIIVEIDSTRPSVETRFYKKGIDFIGGTVFVSIYTVVGEQVAEGCSIAYRGLDTTTGVLRAQHLTNATSLAEVRREIEGKYLPKPSENPTEDSLVKVSSVGTSSWKPVSDFLALPASAANSDRVCIVPDGQTKFGYKNAYKTVYNVENVFVIRDTRGTVPQPDPQREQDGVNLRYLQNNYNANPTLDGTETELTGVTLNGTKYKVPSGGGSPVQSDYNQNDSTAADYIKNRPFYSETETILNQTFSTASAGGVNIWATQDNVIQFNEGDTVKVAFWGKEYIREVRAYNDVLYVGNLHLVGISLDTGEPFAVANIYFPAGLTNIVAGTSIATAEAQTNATITIEQEIIKSIDAKFIPDGDLTIEVSTDSITDEALSTVVTNYVTNNSEILDKLKIVSNFVLKVTLKDYGAVYYKFNADLNASATRSVYSRFVCIYNDYLGIFDTGDYLNATIFTLVDVNGEIGGQITTTTIYSDGVAFCVGGRDDGQNAFDDADKGKLGFYTLNKDASTYLKVSELVSLPEWINLAQQRDDFAIPTPTKGTDLVDKKYVDGKAGGGSVAVEITAPATATSGTLTAEQLSTLQASNDNYIIFNDEIYRLADKEHTPGMLSYTHNGWNGTAMQDKSINITVSTLAWTLVVGQDALIKPEGNPMQDSVVKISSTGTTSYLGIDTTATSASTNLITSGAVTAVEYSLSQSIAGCASEPDISTFPQNDDAFFIGEKTSHASKWLPKKQMTLKSHKIHFDAFDSGSTVGQYDDAFISVLCYTETPFTVGTLTTFMLETGQSYPVCSPSYGMVGYVRVSNAAGEITWEDKEGNNIALAGINESSYVVTDIQSFFPFE
nr:MAG TPA: hypothetical protein [Caudoviricetes sp.]